MAALSDLVYESLPEAYRIYDAEVGDLALQRFLKGALKVADDLDDLVDRISVDGPEDGGGPNETSDLVNPLTADAAWLPWLGQLFGVSVNPALPVDAQRDQVSAGVSGFRAGTTEALAAAVRVLLTGAQFAQVYPRTVNAPGDGGLWDVLLVTRADETPVTSAEVVARVAAMGAKPVGVVLRHRIYTASWDSIDATYPTWDGLEGLTWDQIDETGLS